MLQRINKKHIEALRSIDAYAIFLFGSYINKYYNSSSDIDIGIIVKDESSIEDVDREFEKASKEFHHHVLHKNVIVKRHLESLASRESINEKIYGLETKILPILNPKYMNSLSRKIKEAIVWHFIKECPRKDLFFNVLTPLGRFLSRVDSAKFVRVFTCDASRNLLVREYSSILKSFVKNGILSQIDEYTYSLR